MSKRQTVRPDAQPGPNGHSYCWATHPSSGVHCTQPIGHKARGVAQHSYPYVRPPVRWS
ncbi:hypothetical protein PV729_45055 [Streptomyces europaeiscabiei]|uniref:Uncharacterized protein n=1 Tax=Streptomyces europaeiscabiei TaxID=146819 RepID=A0ABU4NWS1_9ACTN|nr:hypothetical protein [Streptomyces europaeiscabiei]MDX2759157.1 hypothetical protein [Streptomyces europaeiscabiei]MDX2767054.1 hypothetical protein [Streptomyces europaeiscabiei]MDX3549783.1 hypothetical protein [Streptomyces europaeiscabiei]MDX3558743.1 hypothetical protein [Streptomyces europaeiscabiei]MDX3707124.1 hypothetical protein [Streptomyces europaeiscabiei]